VTNTQSGNGEREVLWASQAPIEAFSTECADWVGGQGVSQNGLAFRIQADRGGYDALVLERNIWENGFDTFVVIYFHSGAGHANAAFEPGPSLRLQQYLAPSNQMTFPLRVCGQLSGNRLAFAVTKKGDAMAALGTPGRGGVLQLDSSKYPSVGRTGTYVAHVPRGGTAVVSNVTIDGLPAQPPDS
jgi:hypothetical protein